jgi:integrase
VYSVSAVAKLRIAVEGARASAYFFVNRCTVLSAKTIMVTYIQRLLGHQSLRTTERYIHVAKRDVLSVISPLDREDGVET